MKIVDYVVVGASSEARNLEHVVESAIKDGRQPLGGVSVESVKEGYGITRTYYYQAMVKYKSETEHKFVGNPKIGLVGRWFGC